MTVDGKVATVGMQVDPGRAIIAVDGRLIGASAAMAYLLLHKPAGVTSTTRDRHAATTVLDLVPTALVPDGTRLYPVGRLDQDSEGMLLLTNDGGWSERVLHPRHGVEREYALGLATPLDHAQVAALRDGIALDEGLAELRGLRPMTQIEVERLEDLLRPRPPALTWYRATLEQGWKRQLRRMFGAVGAPVQRLVRVRIGPVRIDGLHSGAIRPLKAPEVRGLGAGAGRSRASGGWPVEAGGRLTAILRGMDGLIVALDGPGSSGKSSVGAAAARELGYRFCDTGLLYRAVTWLAEARGVEVDDPVGLVGLVDEVQLVPDAQGRLAHVTVDGVDHTADVRGPAVDAAVSSVSAVPEVRQALLARQRALAADGGIVMAGRDIGTVVLPDADLKIYLDASVEERARRRAEERGLEPDSRAGAEILAALRRRDDLDAHRAVAPLRVPEDARIITTDGNTFEETVAAVVGTIRDAEARRGAASAAAPQS